MVHPVLLDTPAVAERLGLKAQRLRILRMTGGGPEYIKIGQKVFYDLRAIDQWLDTRRVANTTQGRALNKEGA